MSTTSDEMRALVGVDDADAVRGTLAALEEFSCALARSVGALGPGGHQ